MTGEQIESHLMTIRHRKPDQLTEQDWFLIEAALQCGFEDVDESEDHSDLRVSLVDLIAFMKRIELYTRHPQQPR